MGNSFADEKLPEKGFPSKKNPRIAKEENEIETKVHQFIDRECSKRYHPSSVLRLQLTPYLTFQKVRSLIPYIKSFGIEAIYFSPYLQARKNSQHGYDIVSPNLLNPELGSYQDFIELCKELKKQQIGHILDLVSNHMAASTENPWWYDVLENGEESIFSSYFDIDFSPPKKELKGKVLVPILNEPLHEAIENGDVFVTKEFKVEAYYSSFPLNPNTYGYLLGNKEPELASLFSDLSHKKPLERHLLLKEAKELLRKKLKASPKLERAVEDHVLNINQNKTLLKEILEKQNYYLSYWQVASQEVNYRRFFDINDLAAIKVESGEVFEEYHRFILDLAEEDLIQGIRIDHPDGFFDPEAFFATLQKKILFKKITRASSFRYECEEKENRSRECLSDLLKTPEDYAIAEKVIEKRVDGGSTPFYTVIEKILNKGEKMPNSWNIHGSVGYEHLNYLTNLFVDKKNNLTFRNLYQSFIEEKVEEEALLFHQKKEIALLYMASELDALAHKLPKTFSIEDWKEALSCFFAGFSIYRTYERKEEGILSRKTEKELIVAFFYAKKYIKSEKEDALLSLKKHLFSNKGKEILLRCQQFSPPIKAKGLEDTHLYVNNKFIAINEVGGNPAYFGIEIEEFHSFFASYLQKWPLSFHPGTTHDTKRSEDMRLRLTVLSEIPYKWEETVFLWKSLVAHELIDKNMLYFFFQTLLGVYDDEASKGEIPILEERLQEYLLKAAREAKVHTNWVNFDVNYENALKSFVHKTLKNEDFLQSFLPFYEYVKELGKKNTYSALTLRLGLPGVFDLYQGTEHFCYFLVDPDNRREVDFSKEDSKKSVFIKQGLHFRKKNKEIFLEGEYFPLQIEGIAQNQVIGFVRSYREKKVVVLVQRFFSRKTKLFQGKLLLPDSIFSGDEKELKNIFSGKSYPFEKELGLEGVLEDGYGIFEVL